MSEPPDPPTQDVLWSIVDELVTRFEDALPGVQILGGWPGDTLEAQSVWCSSMDAVERSVPGFVGDTRVLMDETFNVVWEVEVHGLATMADTQARMSEIIGALDSTVREDPRLGEFPGLIECLFTTPYRRTAGLSTEGHQGYAQLNLEVRTRLY